MGRSYQLEWIDLGPPYYNEQEYRDCLYQLDRVGRYLGGDRATFSAFKKLSPSPHSILDVGCGGGLFTIRLAQEFPQAKVLGSDISPKAIEFAHEQLSLISPSPKNVSFELSSTPHLNYPPKSFDIVTSTLVCHHLNDQELIDFLQRSYRIAKQGIIFNDLHRHFLAQTGFAVLAPLLFHNRLITHDGLLSIKRAFKHRDLIYYLTAAEIPLERCSITWHWAFRWILWINSSPQA